MDSTSDDRPRNRPRTNGRDGGPARRTRSSNPAVDDPHRLTALDVANLRIEDGGSPMNVAALLLLDGRRLLDADGEPRLALVREVVEGRLLRAPRLRQVLSRPGRGRPTWVDVTHLDVADHVRSSRVAAPGDEAALLAECARLNAMPLPRSRPLWELWLLTGLPDDRVAVLVRLHHVVADGAATIALMGALVDAQRPPTAPAHPPGSVGVVPRVVRSVVGGSLAVVDLVRLGRAPRLSFNRPVGSRLRFALVRADLERARAAAHACGGTVNDVVLTAVGGGVRALLEARHELDRAPVLHVSVPSSLRRPGEPLIGNRVGIRVVPVPMGEPDPARRLALVSAATRQAKRRPPLQPAGALLQRWTVAVINRQRLINVVVSDLPGPTMTSTFAGAPVLEVFQIGVVQGNVPLSIGALSYAGQLNLDVAADADIVPDLPVLIGGIERDFEALGCLRM